MILDKDTGVGPGNLERFTLPSATPPEFERACLTFCLSAANDHALGWGTHRMHFMATYVSVALARQHFKHVVMHCDSEAATFLEVCGQVLGVTLPCTELRVIHDDPPFDGRIWTLYKQATYARYPGELVHLDSDVFLWKPPPRELITEAPVFAQSPEIIEDPRYPTYGRAEQKIKRLQLPMPVVKGRHAFNAGFLGGRDPAFAEHCDRILWAAPSLPSQCWTKRDIFLAMTFIDQYALAGFAETEGHLMETLFPQPFGPRSNADNDYATRIGYSHAYGDQKASPIWQGGVTRAYNILTPYFK